MEKAVSGRIGRIHIKFGILLWQLAHTGPTVLITVLWLHKMLVLVGAYIVFGICRSKLLF